MKKLLALTLVMLVTACGGDATKLTPTTYSALNGWQDDQVSEAFKVFADSCVANASRKNAYQSKEEGPIGVKQNWNRVCNMATSVGQPNDAQARQFFENNFTPYKVETESKSTGTDTGYYEPILRGSRTRVAPYLTPVHGVPSNLGGRKYSRAEILSGALGNRAPILLYVDDPIMLFFLHIQGSGKVRLSDGSLVGLQYAGQNGYSFVPIGRILKKRGELPQPSMQGIRDWLRAHPDQADEVMNTNPSYVFFKLSPGDQMAKGALGIPLTPLRSIAIDDDRATYGVPTYIDTSVTRYPTGGQTPLRRLFVSQDTGGALKGPARADIFFGRGEVEEWQAGHQNAQGNTFWLLPTDEGMKLPDNLPPAIESIDDMPVETPPAAVKSPTLDDASPLPVEPLAPPAPLDAQDPNATEFEIPAQ
ncbi:MAG: murein transglycosylase A [Rickettsiales bacterium]